MKNHVLKGTPDVNVTLRSSARAKRISLRVSQLDGRVTLTVPSHAPQRDALEFLREKEAWIRKHLGNRVQDIPVSFGIEIPFEGQMYHVTPTQGRRVFFDGNRICIPGENAQVGTRLSIHFKELSRDRLAEASDRFARKLGKSYSKLTIRDTRSRWGSCSSKGGIMYSWRLLMAPADVLNYVAAHEVSHLKHMNHSPAFWDTVAQLYGDYSQARAWLKTHGNSLHRYRFEN